jgi:hypothetical protein
MEPITREYIINFTITKKGEYKMLDHFYCEKYKFKRTNQQLHVGMGECLDCEDCWDYSWKDLTLIIKCKYISDKYKLGLLLDELHNE